MITASLLLGGTSIAFGQSADPLYEAAKKEGKVVYWTANDVEPMKRVAAEFQKKYPGVQFEEFEITQGPAQERLVVEARSGVVNADIFDSALSYLDPLLSRDLIAPYDWAAQGVNPKSVYYDNKCIDFYHVDQPIAYNTSMVKDGEIKSWDDMLNPKWKGKIGLESRGLGLAILAQTWGEKKVDAFIDGLKANSVVILKGNTGSAEALAGGQVAIAMGISSARIDRTKSEMGAPVAWSPAVGPVPAYDYVLCVPKNVRHPNAAQLLARWMVGKEGRAVIWRELVFGLATGVDLSPNGEKYKAAGTEVILEDVRDAAGNQARLKHVAERISAR
jgi:iron(III) transport system substrate-binding protein